jgi:hypothetical protein
MVERLTSDSAAERVVYALLLLLLPIGVVFLVLGHENIPGAVVAVIGCALGVVGGVRLWRARTRR